VEQLRSQGISDLAVLRAFGEVPRHLFVPDALLRSAYEDRALPIGRGQTISQPSTQARFLEALALQGRERVLEIGTGSGYQTALLTYLAATVVSVERLPDLADRARRALAAAGTVNVTVVVGDGSLGWRPLAPYDAIIVSAVSPAAPAPLIDQLAQDGRLVVPLERTGGQELVRLTKRGGEVTEESLGSANFVPLKGRHGYRPGNT
jgi:protein-L-isoaspartate(D-aspartate) O-methyltransferase